MASSCLVPTFLQHAEFIIASNDRRELRRMQGFKTALNCTWPEDLKCGDRFCQASDLDAAQVAILK